MYGLSVMLLLLLFAVLVGLINLQCVSHKAESHSGTRRVVGLLLLVTYIVYPFACKLLFSIFNCDTVDSVPYLHSDLSVKCDSAEHRRAEAFAGFMIAAFPVGLPGLYFGMLWLNRSKLFAEGGSMGFLAFFYREYEERYFFWEAIECVRKCLLMGFAAFFQPGSLLQLIVVMVLTVLYAVMLSKFGPYRDPIDDTLAIVNQVMLFLTLLGAWPIAVLPSFRAHPLARLQARS